MPILTKASITKGTPAAFTLDKSLLSALGLVSGNSLFSNQSVWSRVVLTFKSTVNKQTKTLTFDASLSSPTALFRTSSSADNIFRIQRINIYDKDGANLLIPRSAITVDDFDVDMTTILEFFSQPLGVDTYSVSANSVVKISGEDAYNSSIISTASISGDGYVQFTNASSTGIERLIVGLGKNPRTGVYTDIEYSFNNGDAGYGIYENGTLSHVSSVIPAEGDVLKISRVSNVVSYYVNGVLVYTSTFLASGSYYIEASLYDIGSAISNCSISSVGEEELQISQLDFSDVGIVTINYYDNASQLKGQSITPTRDFLLTGTEFYIYGPNFIYHKVVLRDFTTLAIIASTINYTPTVTGWVRADFDSVPLTSGVKYILELDVEGYSGGQNANYSGKSGNVYAGGAWMEGAWTAPVEVPTKDLAFKIHGKSVI
jgi:hypothetical protein